MATQKKELTPNEWTALILGVALLGGILVRLFPALQSGFPPNDGGMFLSMARDLKVSAYVLPKFTSYNQIQIPYAYPPFGFYLTRVLADLLPISDLDLLRFVPPLTHSLTILALYFLAAEILQSKALGALTSALYALTPGAYSWHVMGGGLTRSFGALFLLLTALFVCRLFQSGEKKFIVWASLFGGLTILSHPEASVQTVAVCLLLWIFFGRSARTFLHATLVAVGAAALSAPWWTTVVAYHGLSPFTTAMQTSYHGTSLLDAYASAIFSYEGFLPILPVLRVVGLIYGIYKRKYFLLAWIILPYLVDPRSSPSVVVYPFSMLMALAVAEALPALIRRLQKREGSTSLDALIKNKLFNGALFLYLALLFVECGLFDFRLINTTLKPEERQAMVWIKDNLPQAGAFLLITGKVSPEIDPFIEWFPALTERTSRSTIQGYEWSLGKDFYRRYSDLAKLQQCKTSVCVEEWARRTGLDYRYVVVAKQDANPQIVQAFRADKKYEQVYSTADVDVYAIK
ncbi:MAG: glycosyltransferase family 39 protein [Anaerolineales bacterium]|nr:glycosyltransferase family 39 protein [Anaerolineales bacterium]